MNNDLPIKPKLFVRDLHEINKNEKSLYMHASAINISKLKELNIKNLWLAWANDKKLKEILSLVDLKYLNLYQILAKDLKIIESLKNIETIVLEWNTKATTLRDMSKNWKLNRLEIIDFSKLNDVSEITTASKLTYLNLSWWIDKALKVKKINVLSKVKSLKHLSLLNIKIEDDSLRPISELQKLESLEISNQFKTQEYAYLSSKLKNTQCKMFKAISPCKIIDTKKDLVYDIMVTWRNKPFLSSKSDQEKINKYIDEFEALKVKSI